jgi:hypothetical protein
LVDMADDQGIVPRSVVQTLEMLEVHAAHAAR